VQSVGQNAHDVRMATTLWMADAKPVRILDVRDACIKWTCAISANLTMCGVRLPVHVHAALLQQNASPVLLRTLQNVILANQGSSWIGSLAVARLAQPQIASIAVQT